MHRYDKIENLASEFGVSERTIRRDIMILSVYERKPIYAVQGKYVGGVITEGAKNDIVYIRLADEEVLREAYDILCSMENICVPRISAEFLKSIKIVIDKYSIPK